MGHLLLCVTIICKVSSVTIRSSEIEFKLTSSQEQEDFKTLYYKEKAKTLELEQNMTTLEKKLLEHNETKRKLNYYEDFATIVDIRNELVHFEKNLPADPRNTSRDKRTTRRDRYHCCLNHSCLHLEQNNSSLCTELKNDLAANKIPEKDFIDNLMTAHLHLNRDVHIFKIWQKSEKNEQPRIRFLKLLARHEDRNIIDSINIVLKYHGIKLSWEGGLDGAVTQLRRSISLSGQIHEGLSLDSSTEAI